MELRFTVWQFVRLMVYLEEYSNSSARLGHLFAAWSDAWSDLDRELEKLSAMDADAYGAMMMDQDIVIGDATPGQAAAGADALRAVVAQMDGAIAHGGDEDFLQSLKFERRELRQLARNLERKAKAEN